ncbi:MAG: ABC transporter substrate-binding protein [Candidatus Atribacteria bacterium]|nr:MAG: ABC transporter substrate-binding protein [Candidatus Atribacteria bacterium]
MKRLNLVILVGLVIGLCTLAVGAAPLKIGITKIVEHPALDAVEQGVIDAFTAAGYEQDVDIVYLLASAQGELTNAVAIAQNFQSQNVDLVVAIATTSAQAAAEVYRGTTIPVIYGAVTDPVEAAKLVLSATDPSGNENITGVSDMIPVAAQLALLKGLSPNIKRIGIVYNAGEPNSVILTQMAEAAAPGLGLTIVTATADSSANVPIAAQSLIGRVDAYYVTTDNAVVSAIDSVLAASLEANVPFLVADPTSLAHATLAAGFDYYDLGLTVGNLALRVLSGTRPNEIPVTYVTEGQLHLNLDLAAQIGLEFPASLIEQADAILYGGVLFSK